MKVTPRSITFASVPVPPGQRSCLFRGWRSAECGADPRMECLLVYPGKCAPAYAAHVRRKVGPVAVDPLHVGTIPPGDLQDGPSGPFSEPEHHLAGTPDQVVGRAHPGGFLRLGESRQILPCRFLQIERAPHSPQHIDGSLDISLCRVGILEGASDETTVGIGQRPGFEHLPDAQRIHDQFVRQIQHTAHAFELLLHEPDIKAYIVSNQHVRRCQERLNLVGDLRETRRIGQVFHGNPVYGLGTFGNGDVRPYAQRHGPLLPGFIQAHGNFHDLIGFRVLAGRFHIESNHYLVHNGLSTASIEISFPYRPALVEETEHALKSGERLTAFKILIAPSGGEARFFRLALARAGVRLVNVEAVTLHSLARLILRTVPGAEPAVFWGGDAAQVVVSRCLELLGTPADHYLRRSPATAERLISVLRVRGIGSDAWRSAGGDPVVADLLEAYADMLRRCDALDATGMLLRAAERVEEFVRLRNPTLLVKLDDIRPLPGERLLLEQLEQHIRAVESIGASPPSVTNAASFRILKARDRDDEVTNVLGDVLASGRPFDEVQIALAQPAVYGRRLAVAARTYGIPVVMDHGGLFFDTPPGRHVQALLKWVSGGLRPEQAVACARAGLLNQDDRTPGRRCAVELLFDAWPVDMVGLLSPDYAGLLREAVKGASDAVDSLVSFARKYIEELLDDRGQLRPDMSLQQMIRWVRRVLADVPSRDTTWTDIMNTALRGRAAQVIPESITMPVTRAADVLLGSLQGVQMPVDDGPPGSILVLPLERAALSLRRATWVVGMDDNAAAGRSASDTDGLPRSAMDVLYRLGYDAVQEEVDRVPLADLLDRLSRRTSEITLCVPAYDVRQARELFPHAACAGLLPEDKTHASMMDRPDPVLLVPLLAQGLEEKMPRIVEAWNERSGTSWTAQNGILGHTSRPTTASASSLERLSECPYRYFVRDILGVRPREKRTEWLTAAERGSLMHIVFKDAHVRGLLTRQDGHDAIAELVRERLEKHARLSPPPGSYTRMATETELISMVGTLRALAAQETETWTQVEAEWKFRDVNVGPWRLRGQIDRVDRNPQGEERILDYKTGSSSPYEEKKLTAMQHRLQWFVYALVRKQSEQATVASSGYLFVKEGEWGTLQVVNDPLTHDGARHLDVLADRVNAGWFPQAAGHSESPCMFCDVRPVCGDVKLLGRMLKNKTVSDDDFRRRLDTWWYAERHLFAGEST